MRAEVLNSMLHGYRAPLLPPWMIGEHNNACFVVKDATGQGTCVFPFRGGVGTPLGSQAGCVMLSPMCA